MRFTILLIIFTGVLITSGCKKDNDSATRFSSDINFKLSYDGEPLILFDEAYTYPDGLSFKITRFSFYLSDVAISDDENSFKSEEVEYLTFTQTDISSATEGVTLQFQHDIPEPSSLSFSIGLQPDQNGGVPEDHRSSNPLSLDEEYWRSWDSYVFCKIEGSMDYNGDGQYDSSERFALHLGTDDSRRDIRLVLNEDNQNLAITIDLKDVFLQEELYDMESNSRLHSLTPDVLEAMSFLANGLEAAITK